MRYLKTQKQVLESKTELSFIDAELDYSELFRLFNVFNESLPDNIDKKLFDKNKYYADIITENTNDLLQKKFNIKNGLSIKEEIDKKWWSFIDFLYETFKNGNKKTVDINFLKDVNFGEEYKSNKQSFHNFINDKKYHEKQTGELKEYYESFNWFDKSPNNIPIPVILQLNNKYYIVGGNRRLSWLISNDIEKIPIWLIKWMGNIIEMVEKREGENKEIKIRQKVPVW